MFWRGTEHFDATDDAVISTNLVHVGITRAIENRIVFMLEVLKSPHPRFFNTLLK